LIHKVYQSPDNLLILCPPRIKDVSPWLKLLPSGTVEFVGELKGQKSFEHSSEVNYPESPKFGLFSTGTENGAKLILYTNQNFETSIRGIFSFFSHLNIKKVFSYPQPYHIFGLGLGYLSQEVLGLKLIVPEGAYSRDAHELWYETLNMGGQELLTLGTPTHFTDALSYMHENYLAAPPNLASIAGGARVEKAHWKMMQDELNIINPSIGYGCSEASPGITHLAPGLEPKSDSDLGKVIPGGELLLENDQYTYVGKNVCLAIIQDGKIVFPQGKYLLSDGLSCDEEGNFFYQKRGSLILNRGGEKFSLEEIEQLLKKELKLNAIALAVEDGRLGYELGLVYEGSELSANILATLSQHYQRSFNPKFLIGITKLPVNSSAKFDRQQCAKVLHESR
jgi:acyl-CoA synthetase (AMP-forming)/AMP-acid ligase II